jgi:hypothetical protein
MSARTKTCVQCGRQDTKGFSKLPFTRFRDGHAKRGFNWVCRPGFGCDGAGPVFISGLVRPSTKFVWPDDDDPIFVPEFTIVSPETGSKGASDRPPPDPPPEPARLRLPAVIIRDLPPDD